MRKIDPLIERELEATGLPWSIEKGSGHRKIRLAGRLAGVLSGRPAATYRKAQNTIAQIRRVAREHEKTT